MSATHVSISYLYHVPRVQHRYLNRFRSLYTTADKSLADMSKYGRIEPKSCIFLRHLQLPGQSVI